MLTRAYALMRSSCGIQRMHTQTHNVESKNSGNWRIQKRAWPRRCTKPPPRSTQPTHTQTHEPTLWTTPPKTAGPTWKQEKRTTMPTRLRGQPEKATKAQSLFQFTLFLLSIEQDNELIAERNTHTHTQSKGLRF